MSVIAAKDGYRFGHLKKSAKNSDDLFIILIFSGGGTRAAAMAYGALRELGSIKVPGANRSLLDEVDVISSVSGGSFPAAFLALNGSDRLPEFEDAFLRWNAEHSMIWSLLNQHVRTKLASDYYSRIDLATDLWEKHLFRHATFDSLTTRPFIIVNATDLSQGTVFPFVQEEADPLCIDLGRFPLARAVGASGAFPPLLNPVTLVNHADLCRYDPPRWAFNATHDKATDPASYLAAVGLESYQDQATRPYIHLSDGGVADNIGARSVVRAISTGSGLFPLSGMIQDGTAKRVLILVVNAKPLDPNVIDKRPYPPGFLETALRASGAPMDNYSRASIIDLWDAVNAWERDNPARVCAGGVAAPCNSLFYRSELSFDDIPNADERAFFQQIPTSYGLDNRTVDLLIALGRRLVREDPEVNRLLCDIGANGLTKVNDPQTSAACALRVSQGALFVGR